MVVSTVFTYIYYGHKQTVVVFTIIATIKLFFKPNPVSTDYFFYIQVIHPPLKSLAFATEVWVKLCII